MLIDDFARDDGVSTLGGRWRGVSDRVMGGVSIATLSWTVLDGRRCLRLVGEVRLDNNGGFLQASLDLGADGEDVDARAFDGLTLAVRGNGESYGLHLRTPDCRLPWQSYRRAFVAPASWTMLHLPFAAFQPHRLTAPLDRARLRRLGIVAIGRAFTADVAVARLAFE